jgi:hypothetical protein
LLHRKFEGDLPRALAAAHRVEDPRLRFKVIQGIGWGVEFRFEKLGSIEPVARQIDALPLNDRVPFVSGLRYMAQARRDQVAKRVAAGEEGPRDRELLARLVRLWHFSEDQWQRIPSSFHFVDRMPP